MKIASIGRDFAHREVTDIAYNSSRTVLEFDSLFIDTAGLAEQGINKPAQSFRHSEFTDVFSQGRTIVIFMGKNSIDT